MRGAILLLLAPTVTENRSLNTAAGSENSPLYVRLAAHCTADVCMKCLVDAKRKLFVSKEAGDEQ